MGTAQETYGEMVREGLRPSLEALGFKGSGTTFTWPSRSHFSHLGLQKSQFSDRDALRFTINVTVADKSSWEAARTVKPYLPKKPAPNTFYGDYIWQRRIGTLMPSGEDTWWTISAGDNWRPVAEAILAAVTTYALPELQNRDAPSQRPFALQFDLELVTGLRGAAMGPDCGTCSPPATELPGP